MPVITKDFIRINRNFVDCISPAEAIVLNSFQYKFCFLNGIDANWKVRLIHFGCCQCMNSAGNKNKLLTMLTGLKLMLEAKLSLSIVENAGIGIEMA
jgi:hypothetical protein